MVSFEQACPGTLVLVTHERLFTSNCMLGEDSKFTDPRDEISHKRTWLEEEKEVWHASQTKTQSGIHKMINATKNVRTYINPLEVSPATLEEKEAGESEKKEDKGSWPAGVSALFVCAWLTQRGWKCLEQSSQTRYGYENISLVLYFISPNIQNNPKNWWRRNRVDCWFLLVASLSPRTIP